LEEFKMEYITESLENQHKKCQKPVERVSSYIRIIKGYKTKSGQVPRSPITDRCPNKVMDSTTKNDKRKQS